MPRHGRLVLENMPHHVIHRGHNRGAVFTSEADYLYYLRNLGEWKAKLGCRIYAYCLMTNHVHLIVDPGDTLDNLALLMKRVAARQTRRANRLRKRSGTLWESRYKSSPIQTDSYLAACCLYVEENPVRAGIATSPEEYPWSSRRVRLQSRGPSLLDELPVDIDSSGGTIPISALRAAIQREQLTGGESFIEEVAARTGRRIENRGQGRPRNKVEGGCHPHGEDRFSRISHK